MTPTAAMQYLLDRVPYPSMMCSRKTTRGRPGELVEKMPAEVRLALAELTSETIPQPRREFLLYACYDSVGERARKAEFDQLEHELKVDFDQKHHWN